MLPIVSWSGLVAAAVLAAACVRSRSEPFEIPEVPPNGTLEIEMSGTWHVAVTTPPAPPPEVPPPASAGGLRLPQVGELVVVDDGEFASAGPQPLLRSALLDPDDWTIETYSNFTTGRFGSYLLARRHNSTRATAVLTVNVAPLDADRMVGMVDYRFTSSEESVQTSYGVLLERVP